LSTAAATATTAATAATASRRWRRRRWRREPGVHQRIIIRTGVDHAGEGFAVPINDKKNLIPSRTVRSPVSDPGTLQRVAFLSGR
jgi:hypothetical protein